MTVDDPNTSSATGLITDRGGEPPIAVGPREQLFHLLAEASEIEHTLMCSYLYAAFSLKAGSAAEFSPEEAQAVGRWRKAILSVAVEEMVHLLLVANLTVSLGGRPHLYRPNFPIAPGYFPSGVVVRLTPFDPDTLEHMIFLERPRGISGHDGECFEAEHDYERKEAYFGLMPSVQDYSTVGRLYEAIRANVAASAARLGEEALFVGRASWQIGPELVQLKGVRRITDVASALDAIESIVEQGEGSRAGRSDSHYEKFRLIQSEYETLLRRNPMFSPARPAAANPVMRAPPEPDGKVFVDSPQAARVLDLANATYNLMLRCIVQSFNQTGVRSTTSAGPYLNAAIDLMHVVAKLGSALVALPAGKAALTPTAGMTFTILRGIEPLLDGPIATQLTSERLRELHDGAAEISRSAALDDLPTQLAEILEQFQIAARGPENND